MSFERTFCSSPWYHMRITPTGHFQFCRNQTKTIEKNFKEIANSPTIMDISPIDFFQNTMSGYRKKILDGEVLDECKDCYLQEEYKQVSGRQRQLLKTGVSLNAFEKTLVSSPIFEKFKQSMDKGYTDLLPIDWQIDLGNQCNGRCVYCTPYYSSSLANEFKKIGLIKEVPPKAWTENEEAVDRFVDILKNTPKLCYLHFLGGETVTMPSFKKILKALVNTEVCNNVSIGLTTNLTVWDQEVADLLSEFKEINLGLSIECFTELNDYLRYPSKINEVRATIERWLIHSSENKNSWLISLRVTATCLSILHLDTVYEYAYENSIGVESCNFLTEPKFMRISVLPPEIRKMAINRLSFWIASKEIFKNDEQIVNVRNPGTIKQAVLQDAHSYLNYLENQPDESSELNNLIIYLKKLEISRNNSILDYLPEYEKLFRDTGYNL